MSTLSATITADTSQFNSAVTKAKGELEKLTNVSKKQRTEFDKAVRTIDRVRQGYVKGKRATNALKSSVQKLTQLHAELKAANSPLADSILRVANAAAKEKANIDKVASSVNRLKSSSANSGDLFKGVGNSFKEFSSLASAFNSGGLVSALGSLAGPLSVVTAGFAGLNEVIKNNETLFDKWQGVVSGAGTAWTNFMRTFNFSTIGASFKAGQRLYNASDSLASFRDLNATVLGGILDDTQKAKTDKKEGKPWSNQDLENLKKKTKGYFTQEEKLLEEEATAKKGAITSGLNEGAKKIANEAIEDFSKTSDKYNKVEEWKKELENTDKKINKLEKEAQADVVSEYGQLGSNNEEYWDLLKDRIDKIKAENKELYDKRDALKNLVNGESSISELVKILNDQNKSSQEKNRLIAEIAEAAATPDKNEYEKDIKQLYEELWKKEEIINKELAKPVSERNTGLLQKTIEEYKEIEGKIYNRFKQFESPVAQAFWKEWTDVEHAKLENKDVDKAIEEARANLLKYANERGFTIEEFIAAIEEEFKSLGKDWSWYGEVTDKYYKTGTTKKILDNLGSSEDMRRLIQRSIDKEVTQLSSKYPNPKSPSYFKEVAGIYDKNLKYLVNYENEIETLQKKQANVQEELDSMTSGVGKEIYDREAKNLEYIYKAKIHRHAELSTMGDVVDPKALEDAENEYRVAFSKYLEYNRTYYKKIEELERNVEGLENNIKELEESKKPYQEMKKTRDSFLQQAGIRPYPAFQFKDYKEEQNKLREQERNRIEQIGVEVDAVNNLASSWSNLWEIIGVGNDKTKQTMQALGSAVTDATNMFKILAENELAASQAVALGKATSSASGLPFPYNLVAMGTVAATVTSMFAKFASIGRFAEGGIVGGNSSIGDYNLARVNSGEMILNGTQQKRLFNMLNGEGGQVATNSQPQTVELVIRGKDLVGTFNNYNNRLNRVR